jgi:hypothetical protein
VEEAPEALPPASVKVPATEETPLVVPVWMVKFFVLARVSFVATIAPAPVSKIRSRLIAVGVRLLRAVLAPDVVLNVTHAPF